jgi:hypothetical protein
MDGGNTGNAGRLHGCRWYESMEGIGRVESGTETETMSGTNCRAIASANIKSRRHHIHVLIFS